MVNHQTKQTYLGQYCNGHYHGEGEFTNADDSSGPKQFIGQFQNGKFHGHGTEIMQDGRFSFGRFNNGQKVGKHTVVDAKKNGRKIEERDEVDGRILKQRKLE